jgi:tRNA1Val (adenine37-N6)-methyltransferase
MSNPFFRFKQFTIEQDVCAMKVCTDACLFGAWCAAEMQSPPPGTDTLLDIGTGTGLLPLMLLQKHRLQVDAVEIDPAAVTQARQNAKAAGHEASMNVIHADVQSMPFLKSYDYIISNPPFYQNNLKGPDSKRNTAHHGTSLRLETLVQIIAGRLKEEGFFFLLLPYRRKEELQQLLEKHHLYGYKEVAVRQTPSHAPFRHMLKGGCNPGLHETGELAISIGPQQYTPAFTALLKDYYLYL